MYPDKRKLLIASFDRPLTPDERRALDEALAASPQLADEKRRIAELRARMASAGSVAFKPFFSGRVMEQLQPQRVRDYAEDFAGSLSFAFKRVAMAAAVVALMLASYNTIIAPTEPDASPMETVFAIPPVSFESAFALEMP